MDARMKLTLAVVFASLTLAAIAACGQDESPTPTPAPTATATPVPPAPTAAPEPTTTPEPTATPVPPTATARPEPTATATAKPAPTATASAMPEPTPTATLVPTPTATATATPTPVPTPTPEPVPTLAFDPAVVRGTLSNGLSYYIRHNEEPLGRAQISLAVKAGSVLETDDQQGLAHFVEHMAFNGTERFAKQEIVEYLESIGSTFGADLNARTGFDDTLYFLEVPTDDPEITERAFQILSDWAYAVSFDPEEVELERGVVLEEWRLYQGFDSRLQQNLLDLLFGSSLYASRAPIGLTEVIENAPVETLRAYYERWYRPDLMAVVAVGDFDVETIEAKIKQYFAPPPEGEAAQERAAAGQTNVRPVIDVPGHETPLIEVFTDPESPATQFVLIRKLAPETGRDEAAFRRTTVERLAYSMLNARLFERGQSADPPYLSASAGRSNYVYTLDITTFSSWVETDGVETGLAAVLEEIQRAHQHGFTEGELEREKSNLLRAVESQYKQRDQTPSTDLAADYSDHFFMGSPVPGIEAEWELYQQLLPQISLADFAANVRPELVATFSRIVNNAAEHGMTEAGAHAHVRFMPHRRGHAFDAVIADSASGIRDTLTRNSQIPQPESDADAIGMAIQELVSGAGVPIRGIGLWMTLVEMQKPGRKLWLHSGSGLLTIYGDAEPELRETEHRQGTLVRLTIPA